jgi:glycosyltransferase involved in cell wall biosynthesis
MKGSLIILTYNEIEGAKALFEKIPFDQFDEYFAIDPGSTDGTVEFFKEKGIKVVFQNKKGRGEAFCQAAGAASGDILVFFSPDGNENPADAVKLKKIIEQGYDIAIASRFLPGSRFEKSDSFLPLRKWGNQFFTFLVNLFFKGNLSDTINGFRAIRKDKFKELKVDAERFAIEYQMSIRALKLKQKIKEIPTIESDRVGGKSKAKSWPVGFDLLKMLFKEILIGKNF